MDSKNVMQRFFDKKNDPSTKEKGNVCYSRIDSLLDKDSFVELNSLVKPRVSGGTFDRPPVEGDGVVTGYGTINDRLVYVAVSDPKVYGGSLGQMHAAKISMVIDEAIRSEVPFIMLSDTGGARIEEGVLALEGLAGVLSDMSMAAESIPVITAVLGPCAGGSAVAAALSHFRFMTKTDSLVFMNGPMVTAATEGKQIDPKEIGGHDVHSSSTGFASFVSEDEENCLKDIRNLMSYFPDAYLTNLADPGDDLNRTETALDELAASISSGYSMDEIPDLVFDKGSYIEVSASYAASALTALARMDGFPVAVIATRKKRLDAQAVRKLSDFIKTCDMLGLPLISFVDCEGFEIGLEHERSGIILDSAQLYKTINNYSAPKIAVLVGNAIGTAYLTLAGKNAGFDFVYAWPTAKVAVVTPDTAANILYKNEIASADDVITSRKEFTDKYEREIASPETAASYGHVDEIIFPSSTRPRIASSLQIL